MTGALARIEARHLARSPLLWLGVVLERPASAAQLPSAWPVLAGDDLLAYQNGFWSAPGRVLAGAWLGLRDRASGAADLLAVTPTAPWRLWWSRLAGRGADRRRVRGCCSRPSWRVSVARGGRGMPDLRLLADGVLAVVLSGLGRRGRRPAQRLAPGGGAGRRPVVTDLPVRRRSPASRHGGAAPVADAHRRRDRGRPSSASCPTRSGRTWATCSGWCCWSASGSWPWPPVAAGSARRWRRCSSPSWPGWSWSRRAGWGWSPCRDGWWCWGRTGPTGSRSRGHGRGGHGLRLSRRRPGPRLRRRRHPDGLCLSGLRPGLARVVHEAVQPVAGVFAGLPGVPTRVRMVPKQSAQPELSGSEVQFGEPEARALSRDDRDGRSTTSSVYLSCALGEYNWGAESRPPG